MASVMEESSSLYQWIMEEKTDPRVNDWLLMSSPWPTLVLTILYLLVVKFGPKWMEHREPFNLKTVLIVYNFALVLLSAYMFWEFLASSILQPGFSVICEPVDYSTKPHALRLASVCWWYFFSKVIEFLDTVFFILRKKNNQISFLHVYHHATMVLLWWIGVRFVAGGEAYFSAMINCWIHILMYTYYLLSAMGPHMQKYLWWKRYMTSLQLMQFFAILIHTSLALYWDCGIPRAFEWALILYMISHILLFGNFYHKTYVKGRSKDKSRSQEPNGVKHQQNGKPAKID